MALAAKGLDLYRFAFGVFALMSGYHFHASLFAHFGRLGVAAFARRAFRTLGRFFT